MSCGDENTRAFLDRLAVLKSRHADVLEKFGKTGTHARRELRDHMAAATDEDLNALALKEADEREESLDEVLEQFRTIRENCRREQAMREGRDETDDLMETD